MQVLCLAGPDSRGGVEVQAAEVDMYIWLSTLLTLTPMLRLASAVLERGRFRTPELRVALTIKLGSYTISYYKTRTWYIDQKVFRGNLALKV